MSLRAETGNPFFESICQPYNARPLMRLAMRWASITVVKLIIEKTGVRKTAIFSGKRAGLLSNLAVPFSGRHDPPGAARTSPTSDAAVWRPRRCLYDASKRSSKG
jgi:hypothetical protein